IRRRISSAVGGSDSKEMIVSVTLGAYMAAISSASRSVASLMLEGDPLPEVSLVMCIAFPRLARAVQLECAPRGRPAHPPGGQKFWGTPPTELRRTLHANFRESTTPEARFPRTPLGAGISARSRSATQPFYPKFSLR